MSESIYEFSLEQSLLYTFSVSPGVKKHGINIEVLRYMTSCGIIISWLANCQLISYRIFDSQTTCPQIMLICSVRLHSIQCRPTWSLSADCYQTTTSK